MGSRKIAAMIFGIILIVALGGSVVMVIHGGMTQTGAAVKEEHSEPASNWVSINATVVKLEGNRLTVGTEDGKEMEIGLGPTGYWYANGIELAPGDSLAIKGFYSGDEFEPGQILNKNTGDFVILRLEDGSPAWAGEGHGGE